MKRALGSLRRTPSVKSFQRVLFSSDTKGRLINRVPSHQFLEATEAFNNWRRQHTVFLVSGGVVIGAALFGTSLYVYLDKYPNALEYFLVERTARAFDAALSFESRKKVYTTLPEIVLPNIDDVFFQAVERWLQSVGQEDERSAPKLSAEAILFNWADLVNESVNKAESSWMLTAKTVMRGKLVEEIQKLADVEERILCICDIIPPSVERNIAIAEQIEDHLEKGEFFSGAALEKLRPQSPEESCDIRTRLLVNAIAFFPGPINRLIHFLQSPIEPDGEKSWDFVRSIVRDLGDVVANHDAKIPGEKSPLQRRRSTRILESTGLVHSALEKTLLRMKLLFDDLPERVQDFVLHHALTTSITNLRDLPSIGGFRPYDLYVRAIDNDLIGPLRRDARISEDILQEVKTIFLAVPGDIQARVLLTAILHPVANKVGEFTSDDQAMLVRDLLSSGGVVAVKLAQMLAEHPRVPLQYQVMLGSLRDENVPMSAPVFWFQIPSAVRSTITELGRCLGTGSVKQANRAKFVNGGEMAVVVLRNGVEDEALSSIGAMETSNELGPVARQLGRLVYGEFNLFGEGEVLEEFANTPIGTHPLFHVVKVKHHSPKCLVEEIAQGTSVAKVLENTNELPELLEERKRTLDILVEYHKAIMSAFIQGGLIHSDVHLGNATKYDLQSEAEDSPREGFMLFDIGQFERIGVPDRKAILWTLSAITPKMRVLLRPVAIAHLTSTCSLHDKAISNDTEQRKLLKEKLNDAFAEAIEPMADGEVPDQRTAYMLFLRAAEKNGVEMPKGAFSVAKMIDGIVSQQQRYELPVIVDDTIEIFLKASMTWGEFADIGARKFL